MDKHSNVSKKKPSYQGLLLIINYIKIALDITDYIAKKFVNDIFVSKINKLGNNIIFYLNTI